MTTEEYISVRATLHALENKNFLCSECLNTYNHRQNSEKLTDELRRSKSCETVSDRVITQIESIKYKTCPGNFFDHSVVSWISAHQNYKNGVMPFPGSFSEQPAKVIELFSIIDNFQHERSEKQLEKARKKQHMQLRGRRRG